MAYASFGPLLGVASQAIRRVRRLQRGEGLLGCLRPKLVCARDVPGVLAGLTEELAACDCPLASEARAGKRGAALGCCEASAPETAVPNTGRDAEKPRAGLLSRLTQNPVHEPQSAQGEGSSLGQSQPHQIRQLRKMMRSLRAPL